MMKNFRELLTKKQNFKAQNQPNYKQHQSEEAPHQAPLTLKELEYPTLKAPQKRTNHRSLSFQNLILENQLKKREENKENNSALANQALAEKLQGIVARATEQSPELHFKAKNRQPKLFFNDQIGLIEPKPPQSIGGIAFIESLTQSLAQEAIPNPSTQQNNRLQNQQNQGQNLPTITSSEELEIQEELNQVKNQLLLRLVTQNKLEKPYRAQEDIQSTISELKRNLQEKTQNIVNKVLGKRDNKQLYLKAREQVKNYLYTASKPQTERTNTHSSKSPSITQLTPTFEQLKQLGTPGQSKFMAPQSSLKQEDGLSTGHKSIDTNEENLRYAGGRTARRAQQTDRSLNGQVKVHSQTQKTQVSTTKSIKDQIIKGEKSKRKITGAKPEEITVQQFSIY